MANLRDALSAVRHEESRRKLILGSPSSSPLEASALASQRASFPHGDRRANNVTTESGAPESLPFSKEQLEMLQKLFGQSLPVSNPSIIGAGSVAHKGNSTFTLLSQHVLSSSWIVDSGASEHMTGNFKLLDSYCPSKESHSVRITNGSCSKVFGSGTGNGYQGSGSERARRDATSRSIQASHAHHSGHSEAGEQIMKGKNPSNMAIREKNIKRIGPIKQKRPHDEDHLIKAARTETSKQLLTPVVDVGPSADWVKISVRETRDCFEVYGLVPGLLRKEVRIQSDPAGRLVIMGQPQQVDDPWGVAPFQKIIGFPARINPRRTSAFIGVNGRLFVRVPFEQSKKCS